LDPEFQLPCRYRPSLTRVIFGGAKIFKEGNNTARITTIATVNNYLARCAEMKHCETHLPIEEANSGKCRWRRSKNCTPGTAKWTRREVNTSTNPDESRSHMSKLQP
jgi:hypothetical protein